MGAGQTWCQRCSNGTCSGRIYLSTVSNGSNCASSSERMNVNKQKDFVQIRRTAALKRRNGRDTADNQASAQQSSISIPPGRQAPRSSDGGKKIHKRMAETPIRTDRRSGRDDHSYNHLGEGQNPATHAFRTCIPLGRTILERGPATGWRVGQPAGGDRFQLDIAPMHTQNRRTTNLDWGSAGRNRREGPPGRITTSHNQLVGGKPSLCEQSAPQTFPHVPAAPIERICTLSLMPWLPNTWDNNLFFNIRGGN